MKIVQLTAENLKRLSAVQITPDGSLVRITGRNGQGKTSVLDAIAYAMGGGSGVCEQPVRKGTDKARVICELDEDLIVTRTFTAAGGGALTVTSRKGLKYPSPQAMLDKLVGKLSFDPLAFSRMPAKAQAETLRNLVGLDFSKQDAEAKRLFDERTIASRSLKQCEGQLVALPIHADAPKAEVSPADLVKKLQQAREHNQKNGVVRSTIQNALQIAGTRVRDLLELEAQIAGLQARAKQMRNAIENDKADEANFVTKLNDLTEQDTAGIEAAIAQSSAVNAKVRANAQRATVQTQIKTSRDQVESLTKQIEAIDEAKARALAESKFPVDGLSFDENGVLLNGVPFSQASAAEQLTVSVAMGLSMNPKLRVLLIRDGSLLDAESLKIIGELAERHDAQIWIERVSDGQEVGVVIEDGMVKADVPSEPQMATA